MWLRINVLIFLFTIVSCFGPSEPDAHPSYQKKVPSPIEEKTLIFGIIAPDAYLDINLFNNWSKLKKTKDNVHIFAHDPDKLTSVHGIKHRANEANLSEKMAEVLAQSTATRLIIFIGTHGARSGNWCFEHQFQCDLTEESLVEMLKKQANLTQ